MTSIFIENMKKEEGAIAPFSFNNIHLVLYKPLWHSILS